MPVKVIVKWIVIPSVGPHIIPPVAVIIESYSTRVVSPEESAVNRAVIVELIITVIIIILISGPKRIDQLRFFFIQIAVIPLNIFIVVVISLRDDELGIAPGKENRDRRKN